MTDDNTGRVPAPAEHAPRKHVEAYDGYYVVVEDGNPRAWVGCRDPVEVRE